MTDINQKIVELREKQALLAKIKKEESDLRKEVTCELFDPEKEGTSNYEDANFKVKCIVKYNTSVDKEVAIQLCNDYPGIADVFDWKPSLVKKVYDTCDDHQKLLVNQALTSKPGTPTLKIEDV